jgi:hypothetical protein
MAKSKIDDVPEHLERVVIRPLVETFSYNYMYKHSYENFILKVVEYDTKSQTGIAHVYFCAASGEYTHLRLKIPIHKTVENGKTKLVVEDPIVEKKDNENPRTAKLKS